MRGRLEVETAERTLRSTSFPHSPRSAGYKSSKQGWLEISLQSSQPFAATAVVPAASFFVRSPVRRLRLKQLPQMAQGKNLHAHSARRRRRRGKRRTTEREESDLWNLRNSRGEMLAVHSLAGSVGKFAAVKITRRRRRTLLPLASCLASGMLRRRGRSVGTWLARSLA